MNTLNQDKTAGRVERVGLLGGTFDPIHHGHIFPAIETAKWLKLDHLHLLPAHIPPHKTSTSATPLQRKRMVELVCNEFPLLQLDDRELARDTPSYTIDSVKEISQELTNAQLFFIMGMDSLLSFTTWHQWQNILDYCHIVVNVRPGYQLNKVQPALDPKLNEYIVDDLNQCSQFSNGKIIIHQQLELDISSTALRQQIANNHFDQHKLPRSVIEYIKQQKLYQHKDN